MDNLQIAILGTGSMGKAILSGLLASGISADRIRVTTKSTNSAKSIQKELGVSAFSVEQNPSANSHAVAEADVVLLGVKPVQILDVLENISDQLKPNALVISVAAGITTASMEASLAGKNAVIRAMPNTPAVLGLGVTGIAKGALATDADLTLSRKLFETIGKVVVVAEDQINALSTISGSGPAYFFYFAEKLINAALKLGFSAEEAELMVKETMLGSAKLLLESTESPEALRAKVTSPNGTTMQAIARFDQANLEQVFIEATEAALARAIELGSLKS